MEYLEFSQREMAAVINLATMMASADGHVDEEEKLMIANEAMRFNLTPDKFKQRVELAKTIKGEEALALIATMNDAQKRYVTAYLGTLMAINGDIDDKEMALWTLVSTICKLPTMTIDEAIDYMAN